MVNNGRASIDILVHGNVKPPAGARVAEERREQKADAKLIQIVTAERGKQKEQFLRMEPEDRPKNGWNNRSRRASSRKKCRRDCGNMWKG